MEPMRTIVPAALAIAAVIVCGAVHGYWSGRWDSAVRTPDSAARMESVALELGDWQGQPMESKARPGEGITGELYRRYVHRYSGEAVTVFLVCGPAGPVSIHPPTACYAAGGYKIASQGKVTLPAGPTPDEFKTARMVKARSAEQTCLRIFWSWSATGAWQTPEDPRLPFARQPVLYKLYVIRELAHPDDPLDGDPCIDLMHHLL